MKVHLIVEYPGVVDAASEEANHLLEMYFDRYDLNRLADEWDAERVILVEVTGEEK